MSGTIIDIITSAVQDGISIAKREIDYHQSEPLPTHDSDLERTQQMAIGQKKLQALREEKKKESEAKMIKIISIAGVGIIAYLSLKG